MYSTVVRALAGVAKYPALPFLDLDAQRLRREKGFAILVKHGKKPLKTAEYRHSRAFQIKVEARRRKVCELRGLGLKIPQIKERLVEEGEPWSEDTIKCDLKSDVAGEFLEELKRLQLLDIALCKNRKVRLEFRDRFIERESPKKGPDVAVNIANQIQVEKNVTVTQLLLRYQQFVQGSDEASVVCSNDSGQSVDKAVADEKAKRILVT